MSLKCKPASGPLLIFVKKRERRVLFIVPFLAIVQEKLEFLRQVTLRTSPATEQIMFPIWRGIGVFRYLKGGKYRGQAIVRSRLQK